MESPEYSNEELVEMVLVYGECGQDEEKAVVIYRGRYPDRQQPPASLFRELQHRLRTRGTLHSDVQQRPPEVEPSARASNKNHSKEYTISIKHKFRDQSDAAQKAPDSGSVESSDQGDLDLSDSGAPSADGNEVSDGAGPAEGVNDDSAAGFSHEDFESCDVSDVKVKVENTDFYSEPEMKRPRVEEPALETKLEEALSVLKDLKKTAAQSTEASKDRFGVYGEHVASKLRGYSEKTVAIVEHAINNILFEADMGNYDGIHTALPTNDISTA